MLVNKLNGANLKKFFDKQIDTTVTPEIGMDASDESNNISHNNNIFLIPTHQNGLIKQINCSVNNQTNSKIISSQETKMNDISLDSHSSHCSYLCSDVQGGNCHIF